MPTLQCKCGKLVGYELWQAGSSVHCKCGQEVWIPAIDQPRPAADRPPLQAMREVALPGTEDATDEINPFASPNVHYGPTIAADAEPDASLSWKKIVCLFFMLGVGAASGFVDMAAPEFERVNSIVSGLAFVIALATWTHLDARQRDYELWSSFVVMLVLCPGPIFVMPYYFINSRGWMGGILACLLSMGFMFLYIVVAIVGALVAEVMFPA